MKDTLVHTRKIKKLTLIFLALVFIIKIGSAQENLPKVANGKIDRIENFPSNFIAARTIDVWLPEGYRPDKKYKVLYMHDGQMLFDSTTTWNKQCWQLDETAAKLMSDGKVSAFIIVGIWNRADSRHPDYFPQKPFEHLSADDQEFVNKQLQAIKLKAGESFAPQSDDYLTFIVKELKPFIDNKYSTDKKRASTFIGGSSMGGLISMYAICQHPRVFGGAICMSTHWPGIFSLKENPVPDAFLTYLSKNIPKSKKHKIYFDCGDQTLDSMYPEIQRKVDAIMIEKGYEEHNWRTEYFPGADHTERAWAKRMHIPLAFMLSE